MLTCYLQGGLGNQLFQIFTTISYALKYKKPFVFTQQSQLDNKRSTYWQSFLSPLAKFTREVNYKNFYKLSEQTFTYKELPNVDMENIVLSGYFQSEKYFQAHTHAIMRLLKIAEQKTMMNTYVKNTLYDIDFTNTLSLHFRRGDYKQLQDFHPLLPYAYYEKALKHIVNNKFVNIVHEGVIKVATMKCVLVFCEQNDLPEITPIIEQLKIVYPTLTFQLIDVTLNDWQQLLVMSLCQHNIIANSSYSWWGAYFNTNMNKIVCYPAQWFGPKLQAKNDIKDLCPPEWTRIFV